MKLCLINHNFRYEIEKLIRIFLPHEKIEFLDTTTFGDNVAITQIDGNIAKAKLFLEGKVSEKACEIDTNAKDLNSETELKIATALFSCFTEITGYCSQWGLLTGVRPAKLFSRLCKAMGEQEAERYFKEKLLVSDKKISLCKAARVGEGQIISKSKKDSFSLYVSIPFCPSRCSYCSFVSHSVENTKKLIPEYVDLLCKEIKVTAQKAITNNLKLSTVYIGGGTPTAITALELEKIMKTISESFRASNILEYTVEAGRPDTITEEKLKVIFENGATRISINPQTMNNSVLQKIGRRHTAEQAVSAFMLARKIGFTNINMDLIAGLPSDTKESFEDTLNKILMLNPESVTVHSLALKRSSNLNTSGAIPDKKVGDTASFMVDIAREKLEGKGIYPYYMYRQSKTVGNLENVGYAKRGYECLYNVYIMDETHSILACGASAVTKLRQPGGDYIERIFNFKYPYEYISRFDELIERKNGIDSFYNKYS